MVVDGWVGKALCMDAPATVHRMRPDLDGWLATPSVRTTHRRESDASAPELWRAAQAVRLRDCGVLGRLITARVAGAQAAMSFEQLFRTPPFVTLERGATWTLAGLCGRIWSVRGDLGPLAGPQEFATWSQPGTVRVLFAHWAEATDSGSALYSEVRVAPVDRRAGVYLRALEPFIAAFQGLVGREALARAVRRARTG
jgi:hypothetical protein